MKYSFVIVLIIVSLFTSGEAQKAGSKKDDVITLCELMEHWNVYNRHTVRVRAVLGSGAEQMWLSDSECGDGQTFIDFEIHPDAKKDVAKKVKELTDSEWVIFEGTFFGPEPFDEIDPKLPESVRQRLANSHKRYGHMDSFDASLKVLKIIP